MEIGQFAQAFGNISQVGQITQTLKELAAGTHLTVAVPTELAQAAETLVGRSCSGIRNGGLINVPSAKWC